MPVTVAHANGVVLHYRLEGPEDAPVLVFANSLGTDFRIWDDVVAALKGPYRILRYDKRGHGLSGVTPPPYSLHDTHAADLVGLMDHLGLSGAVLCGLSVGGMITQAIAAMRPDLVRAMVLMDTGHKIATPEVWRDRIAAVARGGIEALADATMQRWFSNRFRENEPTLAVWRRMVVTTPEDGYVGTCHAIANADLTDSTKALTLPALCICGDEDGSTPPALMKALTGLLQNARYVEIESAGHLPNIEHPGRIADLIDGFIQAL